MKSTQVLYVLLVILIFTVITDAQDEPETHKTPGAEKPFGPIKVDEFGRLSQCDASARVQNFYVELANNLDSTGYIIIYKGADILPSDYGADSSPMRNLLSNQITFLRLDESRVTFVDGGFRKSLATELWLVPPGFPPPGATDTVEKPTMPTDKTFLWGRSTIYPDNQGTPEEEFILPSIKSKLEAEARLAEIEEARMEAEAAAASDETDPEPADEVSDESEANDSQDYADEIGEEEQLSPEEIQEQRFSWANIRLGEEISRRDKNTAVLIFYADNHYYDLKKVEEFIKEGRDKIAKESKVDPKLIKIIFGGYRDSIQAEFWIVPPKGAPPKPTPAERRSQQDTN